MKTKKLKIPTNQYLNKEFIGIVCCLNDYRLCWAINNSLSLNMVKGNPISVAMAQDQNQIFSAFHQNSDAGSPLASLFSNKSGNISLLKKFRNLDFIFSITGNFATEYLNEILGTIKELDIVLSAFLLPKNGISKKEYSYFLTEFV